MSSDGVGSGLTSTDVATWNHPLLAAVVFCASVLAGTVLGTRAPVALGAGDLARYVLGAAGMVGALLAGAGLFAVVDASDEAVVERLSSTDWSAWNHPKTALVGMAPSAGLGNYAAGRVLADAGLFPALAGGGAAIAVAAVAASLD